MGNVKIVRSGLEDEIYQIVLETLLDYSIGQRFKDIPIHQINIEYAARGIAKKITKTKAQ